MKKKNSWESKPFRYIWQVFFKLSCCHHKFFSPRRLAQFYGKQKRSNRSFNWKHFKWISCCRTNMKRIRTNVHDFFSSCGFRFNLWNVFVSLIALLHGCSFHGTVGSRVCEIKKTTHQSRLQPFYTRWLLHHRWQVLASVLAPVCLPMLTHGHWELAAIWQTLANRSGAVN